MLSNEAALAALPHAPPFRFVTQLIEMQNDVTALALWRVHGDEDFLKGHFPGNPIVPGVLLGEALAQVSGLVAAASAKVTTEGPIQGRLAHLDIRFSRAVHPPAEIVLKSSLSRSLGSLHQFEVEATVNGETAARGMLTLALEGAGQSERNT